jgi:hypothetical protein
LTQPPIFLPHRELKPGPPYRSKSPRACSRQQTSPSQSFGRCNNPPPGGRSKEDGGNNMDITENVVQCSSQSHKSNKARKPPKLWIPGNLYLLSHNYSVDLIQWNVNGYSTQTRITTYYF